MKKVVSIVAMVLVAVMALGLFAACGYSGNPEKDAEKLKGKDYKVALVDGSKNAATQLVLDGEGLLYGLKDSGKLVAKLTAEKTSDNSIESVEILYFDSSDSANTAWESDLVKAGKEEADKNENENISMSVKKSGKMIITETKVTKEADK